MAADSKCMQKKVLQQHITELTWVRGTDIPSRLGLVFMSVELGWEKQLCCVIDYIIKEEMALWKWQTRQQKKLLVGKTTRG